MRGFLPVAGVLVLMAMSCAASSQAMRDDGEDELGEEGDDPVPVSAARGGTLFAEVQRQLHALRSTRYSHAISIDERAGRFDYDCSGFVGYAVAQVDGAALLEVRNQPGKRPLAKDFEVFFSKLSVLGSNHWVAVRTVDALEQGDLIAWRKPATSQSRNTGHVMVVAGAPLQRSPGEFVVPIVDSTAVPHGRIDERTLRGSGLGSGSIVLLVDAQGRPTGFRWSARSHRAWETDISMGRLKR